jgi:LysM repeat protein
MWKWSRMLPLVVAISVGRSQPGPTAVDVANLREDLRSLAEKVDALSLRVDQLESENTALQEKAKSGGHDYVTASQLNDAIADLNRTVQAAVAAGQDDTLKQVSAQLQKQPRPSGPAGDAAGANRAAAGPVTFSTDFPKEGINYVVQKGDTVALVAKKTGAKLSDIVNANKLADPSRIRVGQTLFIPGGK